MLQSISRALTRFTFLQSRVVQQARLCSTVQSGEQKDVDEVHDETEQIDTEDFVGGEMEADTRSRYNFDENHIEVTGMVRTPPRIYKMATGRQYAIVKLTTMSGDRRNTSRFVSFLDVFAPNSAVDYIKEHIREGAHIYVSGQLRSRMRTDEDGRTFQDVRIQANGLFKIIDSKTIAGPVSSIIESEPSSSEEGTVTQAATSK